MNTIKADCVLHSASMPMIQKTENRVLGIEWNLMERKIEEGPWIAGKRHGIFKFYDGFRAIGLLRKI